jgi:hypothetical protein
MPAPRASAHVLVLVLTGDDDRLHGGTHRRRGRERTTCVLGAAVTCYETGCWEDNGRLGHDVVHFAGGSLARPATSSSATVRDAGGSGPLQQTFASPPGAASCSTRSVEESPASCLRYGGGCVLRA